MDTAVLFKSEIKREVVTIIPNASKIRYTFALLALLLTIMLAQHCIQCLIYSKCKTQDETYVIKRII